MFRRLLGRDSHHGKKKRLSPVSGATPGLATTGSADSTAAPGYQYALNEFAQTVAPASSNDDGLHSTLHQTSAPPSDHRRDEAAAQGYVEAPDMPLSRSRSKDSSIASQPYEPGFAGSTLQNIDEGDEESSSATPRKTPYSPTTLDGTSSFPYRARQSFPATQVPDAVYEEWYGDAYLGGPIKYIYPSGYQSMRPRGGPWRLSIAVCVLFTWLSVFIIGHCSDRVDQSFYEKYGDIDDDKLAIETRWCGSYLLYMMWVISMLITGLATAYCSVIGYIKVRDFAVANTRSQPPGLVGKSDYYVQLQDTRNPHDPENYHQSIYQSDGNPQFWGGHIYRPTQAAVAITSR